MAKTDEGHKLTDKELSKLERRITKLYREAGKELQGTIDAYFEQFKKRDEEMKALIGTVQNGKEWTEADYKQWRLNQIGRGERYQAMRDKVAHRVTDANAVAASYTNDATPGIYSLNRNFAAYTIESVAGNVGFDLWDEQTVKRLIVEQPGLMPYYPKDRALKRGIDLAYGKSKSRPASPAPSCRGKALRVWQTICSGALLQWAEAARFGRRERRSLAHRTPDAWTATRRRKRWASSLKSNGWRRWTTGRGIHTPCWTAKR